jgi:hypothetical protein
MRGVLGILFIGLGLVLAYFVLSGKFPTASTSATPGSGTPAAPAAQQATQQAKRLQALNTGSGPMGLPTMAALDDLVASRGGIR